jgi:aminoglycoside phosphotransferase (APT) family kinase protein
MSIDGTKPVRAGEELDLARLRPYLEPTLGALGDLEVSQFPGGYSNLTYLLKSGEREWVLRRPPFGSKVKRAHDMGREHLILSKLAPHCAWAPKPLVHCADEAVLGAEFYVMERIRGVILRKTPPAPIDEPTARRLSETLLDGLVELHRLDPREVGLAELGKPDGYVQRQVEGWTRRYGDACTDDISAMGEVAAWLAAHIPASPPARVIHNDYKFDNVVYESTRFERIIGILDWEMATLGDPLMDLGTTLCYWIEPGDHPGLQNLAFGPTTLPGMYRRADLAERYAAKTGADLAHIVFYYVFGLFKTAVVCQQIYYRFKQGLTKDPRFAGLIEGVRLMAEKAAHHIATGALQ